MKVLCPVDSAAEAAELAALGAGELYGGYLPAAWEARYGVAAAPPNRRSFAEAQFRDAGDLAAAVDAAHAAGARFYLTVNAPVYAGRQRAAALDLVGEALALGVDAFIAADAGLMLEARRLHPGVRFHLSTLGDAANHAAVAFWRRLGVERITLPRHLPLAAIGELVAASPGMRFDAFVLYGQCPNAEGHCTFSHDDPGRVWPCVQRWRVAPGDDSAEARRAAQAQAGWGGLVRADACGLCALWDLARLGIDAAKIVGRGAPTGRKRWAVGTVRELLGLIDSGIGREEFLAEALARSRGRFEHACDPRLCYFPELRPGGGPPSPSPLPSREGCALGRTPLEHGASGAPLCARPLPSREGCALGRTPLEHGASGAPLCARPLPSREGCAMKHLPLEGGGEACPRGGGVGVEARD